ncbi:short-chain dehydrogenase [Candidatus Zixiibacteriota bacterium]
MDISGRRILVLGGFGMVGRAICRDLLERVPEHLTVSSLLQKEAEDARDDLKSLFPDASIDAAWGNIFVRESFKDLSRNDLLQDPDRRILFLEDAFTELDDESLHGQALYRLISDTKPDLVVDAINTATALAYQDVYLGSKEVLNSIQNGDHDSVQDATIRLVATQYTPQLVRHVQVLYGSMREIGTGMYIKVGTTGTGGMGLNIPYTHSEERPSRVLLSKSAMAGAHSMLLFLMGRTPDGPIVKEVKPAAVIAWKGIGVGPVLKHQNPIPLFDVSTEEAHKPEGELALSIPEHEFKRLGDDRVLESVYIDTGENGFFSRGEFSVITTIGQMEFITPEEIARDVIREIIGGNTGFDIVSALDMAVMGPTYRAGSLRESALDQLLGLEEEHDIRSVAFEVLGPPRLSKLLYEAELLRRSAGTLREITISTAIDLSAASLNLIEEDSELRSAIISIGIPILLPDGRLLRGPKVKIPPSRGFDVETVSSERMEQWASEGWVDLRVENMSRWQARASAIIDEVEAIPPGETSSRYHHDRTYWQLDEMLDIGKTVGWIFIREDEGERMK